jgi:hypothetical protein
MYICVHKNSLICLFTCTLSTGQTIPVLHLLLHLFPETIATIQPSHPTVAASRAPFSFGKASLKASLALHWWQVTYWWRCWCYHLRCDHQQYHHDQHFHGHARGHGHMARGNHTGSTRTQDTMKLDVSTMCNRNRPSDLLCSSWSHPSVPGNSHDLCFIHVPSDQVSMRLRLPAFNLPVFHGLLVTSASLPRLHPHQICYCVLNMLCFFWLFLTCLFQYSIWISMCSSRCWADYDVHSPFWLEVIVFPFIQATGMMKHRLNQFGTSGPQEIVIVC